MAGYWLRRSSVSFRFADYALDVEARELRCGDALVVVEPQVFDLLVYLIRNRDRVVSKDDLIAGVWGGRIVSESTLNSRVNAARKAVGDNGEQQKLIRTFARKGIRFVGEVAEPAKDAEASAAPIRRAALRQEVQFCTASDGVRIAYAEVGEGAPLVKAANWLTHLEYDWQSPVWSPLLHALAKEHRLVRYDQRGNGLSDWDVADISFEAFVRDLETVVHTVGLERFTLFGISGGCAVSVAYAIRHPERVSRLVLYGGFVRGKRRRGPADQVEADALTTLMRHGWGRENPAFRQIFTSQFIPGGTLEQVQWFNDLQRVTTSPENAVRIFETTQDMDVTDLLPRVQVPTLVLHLRDDARVPFEEGRRMAAGIPGARFIALEGRNHVMLESDPAWPRFIEEITRFVER
jgi:pimeloyl-ACP methyl ester carboxylesterase/DNA-binding winged helix-turn-helix (wHTH) protein